MGYNDDRFFNYPRPIKGPDVPYQNGRKSNPVLRGFILVVGAYLMDWLGLLRTYVWRNAGFGLLRKIRAELDKYEPWNEPAVVPLPLKVEKELAESSPELPPPGEALAPPKYYSVHDYHRMYLTKELTPTAVAEALLPLIRRNASPPGEHSSAWFSTQVGQVLKAAKASTQRYKEMRSIGVLDGVPTAFKDEYDVPGYKKSLGSRNDYTVEAASWIVEKLQEAGAIVMGKLSMHEYGLDTTGNNPIYGTPRNPYNASYYTGGSSSGCGYAVATGLLPIAMGSDGGGSIRIPASYCGVFGLKPTHGRVSFRPGLNHSATNAVLGPMAADVRSLAAVFDVVAAPDPSSRFPPSAPFLRAPIAGRPKILGVPEAWFARAAPAAQQLCRAMIGRLVAERGYTTAPIEIPYLAEGQIAHALTLLTDAASMLPQGEDITAPNRILTAIGRTTPATDYLLAQKLRACLMAHLAHLWREHPGMVIATPTTACVGWPIGGGGELSYGVSNGDRTIQSMEYVWMGNFCGLPGVTVPVGYAVPEGRQGAGEVARPDVLGKVPVGLMAMGEWADEAGLLSFALDAEALGADARSRPPNWVDVVAMAKERMKADGAAATAAR